MLFFFLYTGSQQLNNLKLYLILFVLKIYISTCYIYLFFFSFTQVLFLFFSFILQYCVVFTGLSLKALPFFWDLASSFTLSNYFFCNILLITSFPSLFLNCFFLNVLFFVFFHITLCNANAFYLMYKRTFEL